MERIISRILTIQGIRAITYLILTVMALLYCRILTKEGLVSNLLSIISLPQIRIGTESHDIRFPFYKKKEEDIPMDGGNGKGTVSEVLARETEMKLLNGEKLNNDFIEDAVSSITPGRQKHL